MSVLKAAIVSALKEDARFRQGITLNQSFFALSQGQVCRGWEGAEKAYALLAAEMGDRMRRLT